MEKGLISVDRWSAGSQVYFLTHLHSDHTSGLTSAWSRGPLFCSRLTAKLFPFKFPDFDLSLLRVLEDGSWYSVTLVSPSSGSETVVQVMAIDAHHCPGAVMFLFRGDFGCLLYTGDFRWEADSERAKKGRTILCDALKNDVIDILYLDNTYCNPSYVFPSREVAAQQVVNIISSHPEHDIIIGIDSLGKEDLLIHISRMLKTKIWVWPERLQTMHLLGFHDLFTTKTTLTRVRAVPRYSFSIDTLESLNMIRPTIGIMPSGLPWVKPTKGNDNIFSSLLTSRYKRSRSSSNGGKADEMTGSLRSIDRFHQYIYSVPYSDHSSFTEIREFIELAKPINMKGIVSASACYVEPLYYFGRLCGVSQASQRLYVKDGNAEESKRVVTNESKYCFKDFNPNAEKRKRKHTAVDCLGVHSSRVSALRRKRCGAKIVESEGSI